MYCIKAVKRGCTSTLPTMYSALAVLICTKSSRQTANKHGLMKTFPLVLLRCLQWKGATLHFHGLILKPTHQQSYNAYRYIALN